MTFTFEWNEYFLGKETGRSSRGLKGYNSTKFSNLSSKVCFRTICMLKHVQIAYSGI